MRALLQGLNVQVYLAMVLLQICFSSVYYFSALKPTYMRLMRASRQSTPFTSSDLPLRPLRAVLGTAAAAVVLTGSLHLLALRFGVDTWQDGLRMALLLLLIDACLNARHHFFENRPPALFLLHAGYHTLLLISTCCLLSVFGRAPLGDAGGGRGGGGGGQPLAEPPAAAAVGVPQSLSHEL